MIFEPADCIARLAALVPQSRGHLTHYHGVFAPASALRARIVPKRPSAAGEEASLKTDVHRHRAVTWAQRLKQVFAIDTQTASVAMAACGPEPTTFLIICCDARESWPRPVERFGSR